MGLNRMMMGKGGVKVEDGSKFWTYEETGDKTISFTVKQCAAECGVLVCFILAEESNSCKMFQQTRLMKNARSAAPSQLVYSNASI